MNMTKTTSLMIAMIATTSLLAGCSKDSFQAATGSSGSNSQGSSDNNSGQSTDTPKQPSAWDKLELNGAVGGTSYENEQVIALDKPNNALLLYLPLPPGPFFDLYLDVPEVKGVKIKTVMDSQQKGRIAVSIPLSLILKNSVLLPSASTLPGGRPLPHMPSGEYPSLGLGLKQDSTNKLYLYFGVNTVGLFIESSFFPEYFGVTAPVKNAAGTRTLGYFTIVPKAGAYNGGLFLSSVIPNDLAKIIDDHLSGIIN